MEEILSKWEEIKNRIKEEFDIQGPSFKAFILPLQVGAVDADTITILVPDDITEGIGISIIEKKYQLMFKVCIEEVLGKEYNVDFSSKDNLLDKKKNDFLEEVVYTEKIDINEEVSSYYNVDQNDDKFSQANIVKEYTFDSFVVGENNSLAYAASVAVSDTPGSIYNPLFIWGGPGLGKTHLMHAIGNEILKNKKNMSIIYVTTEFFTNELINAIKGGQNSLNQFKNKYRNIDAILIDDVQFLINKTGVQIEFFNTFNELLLHKKAIVLISDRPPRDLDTLEERLTSRFSSGLIADIQPPDYEMRVAILKQKAENYNVEISDEVINYIASNIRSNVRELEGAMTKIKAHADLRKVPITIEIAEKAISDMITHSNSKNITPELILETVANYYNVSKQDILSAKRNQEFVRPRHIVMYLCKKMTNMNGVNIGKFLGDRDHTTIRHGCMKIEKDILEDEKLSNVIESIRKLINP